MPERNPYESSTRYNLNGIRKKLRSELKRARRLSKTTSRISETGSAVLKATAKTFSTLPKTIYEDVSRPDSFTWKYIENVMDQLTQIQHREDTGKIRKNIDSLLFGIIAVMLSPLVLTGSVAMDVLSDRKSDVNSPSPDRQNKNKKGKGRKKTR